MLFKFFLVFSIFEKIRACSVHLKQKYSTEQSAYLITCKALAISATVLRVTRSGSLSSLVTPAQAPSCFPNTWVLLLLPLPNQGSPSHHSLPPKCLRHLKPQLQCWPLQEALYHLRQNKCPSLLTLSLCKFHCTTYFSIGFLLQVASPWKTGSMPHSAFISNLTLKPDQELIVEGQWPPQINEIFMNNPNRSHLMSKCVLRKK